MFKLFSKSNTVVDTVKPLTHIQVEKIKEIQIKNNRKLNSSISPKTKAIYKFV